MTDEGKVVEPQAPRWEQARSGHRLVTGEGQILGRVGMRRSDDE